GIAQANVASAGCFGIVLLTEITDQRAVPANGPAAVAIHVVHMLESCRNILGFNPRLGGRLLEDGLPRSEVAAGMKQDAFGLQAVAASPARLLLVVLHRLRHGGVQDEAN